MLFSHFGAALVSDVAGDTFKVEGEGAAILNNSPKRLSSLSSIEFTLRVLTLVLLSAAFVKIYAPVTRDDRALPQPRRVVLRTLGRRFETMCPLRDRLTGTCVALPECSGVS
jgi:hypothetical protein